MIEQPAHAVLHVEKGTAAPAGGVDWQSLPARLLPGAFGAVFAHPGQEAQLACQVEDAGFIIHPSIFGWLSNRLVTVIIFQKPYGGRPIDVILQSGAGALSIDAGRIPYASQDDADQAHRNALDPVERYKTSHPIYEGGKQSAGFADTFSSLGRWPANLFISHGPFCKPGTCAPDCPVLRIDQQSGERPAGRGNGQAQVGVCSSGAITPLRRGRMIPRNDTGGASRFFFRAGGDGNPTGEYPLDLLVWMATLFLPPAEYAPRRLLATADSRDLTRAAARAGWEVIHPL